MRILYLDIETTPNLADVWTLWNNNVSLSQLRQSSYIMCVSSKFSDDSVVRFRRHDQGDMLGDIHSRLEYADVVCTYNGASFDIPTLNGEFVKHGYSPPRPYQHVDLYRVVKKVFRFPSHKLDYVAQTILGEGKTNHEGHLLWVKCMAGDKSAWSKMAKYNRQDVLLLEKLYEKFLPWISTHPNRRLYDSSLYEDGCPSCGTDGLVRQGFRYTRTGRYQRYRCSSCHSWSSSTRRDRGTDVGSG